MKTWQIVLIIVIVLVIGGVAVYAMKGGSMTPATTTDQSGVQVQMTTSTDSSGATSTVTTVGTAAPAPQSFIVNGNDATADLKTITVPKGTPVTITFGADAGTTYHGGLDFRSSVLNTGTITPGSTKTVTFTATSSFSFTPYWPATNIAKPYTIDIVVD